MMTTGLKKRRGSDKTKNSKRAQAASASQNIEKKKYNMQWRNSALAHLRGRKAIQSLTDLNSLGSLVQKQ